MKIKSIKRLLTATLAATMLLASTLTVAAEDSVSGNDASSSSSSGGSSAVVSTAQVFGAGRTITVGGTKVVSTIAGSINTKTVQGVAVITPYDQIKASLGLSGSQTPHITVFDTDAKKSYLAMDCVNAATEALGAQVVATLNITLNARENGKIVELSDGSAGMVVGLPAKADTAKTYCVVCVQPGGIITILNDQDTDPATVTFEVKAGLGTYALVAK